jgi:hypothetical protein
MVAARCGRGRTNTQHESETKAGHAIARDESPAPRAPRAPPVSGGIDMIWDFSQPFPPDPNAPPTPSDRASRPRPAIEAPAAAVQHGDALEHDQAQLRLIGPAGGAELRRIVYGPTSEPEPTRVPARTPPIGPRQ